MFLLVDILFEEKGEEELSRTLQDLRDDQIGKLVSFAIFHFRQFKLPACSKHLFAMQSVPFFLDVLLRFLCDWNTNAKHSRISQLGKFKIIFCAYYHNF
jgi:hypothetical protein